MSTRTIVVTGATGPASANVIRSLRAGDQQLRIVGVSTDKEHLEIADVEARYTVPPAGRPEYLPAIERVVRREGAEYVHPQPDQEVRALAAVGSSIGGARLALPPLDVVDLCQDKGRSHARLAEAGVPVPRGAGIESLDDLDDALTSLGAPASQVWLRATRGAQARAALPVRDAALSREWIRYWAERGGLEASDFMVSEFLPGREFAFQSIWWEGELVSSQARERLEYLFGQHTPSGQTSTPALAKTVHDERVNDTAEAAVRAVAERPHGIFCVDLKESEDGEPKVMEINPGRFFTTSFFFTAAGANMPLAWMRLALGEEPPPLAPRDACPADLFWVRNVDVGYGLVAADEWRAVPA